MEDTNAPSSAEVLPALSNQTACSMDSLFNQLLKSSSTPPGLSGGLPRSGAVLGACTGPVSISGHFDISSGHELSSTQMPGEQRTQAHESALHLDLNWCLETLAAQLAMQQHLHEARQKQQQQQQKEWQCFGSQDQEDKQSQRVGNRQAGQEAQNKQCNDKEEGRGMPQFMSPVLHSPPAQQELSQGLAKAMQDTAAFKPLLSGPSSPQHRQLSKVLQIQDSDEVQTVLKGSLHESHIPGMPLVSPTPQQQYAFASRQHAALPSLYTAATGCSTQLQAVASSARPPDCSTQLQAVASSARPPDCSTQLQAVASSDHHLGCSTQLAADAQQHPGQLSHPYEGNAKSEGQTTASAEVEVAAAAANSLPMAPQVAAVSRASSALSLGQGTATASNAQESTRFTPQLSARFYYAFMPATDHRNMCEQSAILLL
jgi:hypothetical protein